MMEFIQRRLNPVNKKYWITTKAFQMDYLDRKKWFNCLYLHFCKEDFPQLEYQKLIECNWGSQKKRFDYHESSVATLDWHGGCTFYEEIFNVEHGKTYVKVGCDYQHLGDDAYMEADYGKTILELDGKKICDEFEQLSLRKQTV